MLKCIQLYCQQGIAVIERLQKENEELKSNKFASWKLKFFNLKEEFDKELAEHEEFAKKANTEIEQLTEWKDKLQDTKDELEQQLIDTGFKEYCEENAELRKQVDELKEERENMQAEILRFEDMKFTQEHCNLYEENEALKQWLKRLNADLEYEKNWGKQQTKQAVKDTAKEIATWLPTTQTDDKNELSKIIKECYGVEVE
jgi:chromosome segregation ATPase